MTNLTRRITHHAKDHPIVIWLGVAASAIAVATFIWGLYQPPQDVAERKQKLDRDLVELLMEAVHELDNNQDYLDSLKRFWMGSIEQKPVGVPRFDKTRSFFSRYFDVIAEGVYGEEDKLLRLVSLAENGTERIEENLSNSSLARFNDAYDLTFDDTRLANGFLLWYLGHVAAKHVPQEFLISLPKPKDYLHKIGPEYEMREFTQDGKPILEYSHLLGLLD